MKKLKVLFFAFCGAALLGVAGVVAMLVLENKEGLLSHDTAVEQEPAKPPPSATEIIAQEFAGRIEPAAHVDPAALTEPLPVELPTTAELGSRELDEAASLFADDDTDKKKNHKKSKKEADRKIASVETSLSQMLSIDKASSKVSKNLDKKKVMSLLARKLNNICQPKLPAHTNSLKAQINLAKNGSISNIKVTPSSAEKELSKCMRKQLGDAKALKPKNKSVAQVTVQFKLK